MKAAMQTQIKRKKYPYISIPTTIIFLFVFQISTHITDFFAEFLKAQEIHFTPFDFKLSTYFIASGIGIVMFCVITFVLQLFVYDRIRKKLKKIAGICGHIFFCLPISFLTLLGVNFIITWLFEAAPFVVWDVAYLIAEVSIIAVLYPMVAYYMTSLVHQQFFKERKNHNLEIYYLSGTGTEKESDFIKKQTFQMCFQIMQTNLSDLKPNRVFVISQYALGSKEPKHQWFYDQKGELIKQPGAQP